MLLRQFIAVSMLWASSVPLFAIDYSDSASVRASPALDLGNLFIWQSSDNAKIYVVVSLAPVDGASDQTWSMTGKYRIHLDRDNDLREDIGFDFYFSQNQEVAVSTGPESLRGLTGQILKTSAWRAFAGSADNFVHGDFEALSKFFSSRFPCKPSTEKGLRCGSGAAEGTPTDSASSQKLGFAALELDADKFGLSTSGRINVWASSWEVQ
jgi:hypothetical protein